MLVLFYFPAAPAPPNLEPARQSRKAPILDVLRAVEADARAFLLSSRSRSPKFSAGQSRKTRILDVLRAVEADARAFLLARQRRKAVVLDVLGGRN